MTELVLIRVTGADKPGLTSGISAILAQYDVTILDIGQAEIHDTTIGWRFVNPVLKAQYGVDSSDILCSFLLGQSSRRGF